jgi:hypothetical protein
MTHFRKKMAAILLSSDMNKRKGCLLYKYEKEVDTRSPYDVQILEVLQILRRENYSVHLMIAKY